MDKLPDEIIFLIYNLIDNTKYSGYFIQINKRNNKLLKDSYKKFYIESLLNKDYFLFYKYLKNNYYEKKFLQKLFIKALKDTLIVWSNFQNGFMDMRFLFELMFNGCEIDKNIISENDLHKNYFYNHFYDDLHSCIIYDNRKKTIDNINKIPKLYSLKKNFIYYKKGHYQHKNYIPLIKN